MKTVETIVINSKNTHKIYFSSVNTWILHLSTWKKPGHNFFKINWKYVIAIQKCMPEINNHSVICRMRRNGTTLEK